MGLTVVTYWSILITKAKALGTARKHGDSNEITKAKEDLESYEESVRSSDRMMIE